MTTRFSVIGTVALLALPFTAALAGDAGLGGSMSSMRRQYEVAKKNDYTFLRTPAQVRAFVREDHLEPLESNEHLLVHKVSFPYARPAVKLFVLRLAEQYHAATGERLVVTSLTRPVSSQPRNAHDLSVHPAGMAVDLRIPKNAKTRAWLESTLLSLEARELLDATRERRPPHYHVAVFPDRYTSYVANLMEHEAGKVVDVAVEQAPVTDAPASLEPSASSDSSHEAVVTAEPVVSADPVNASVPLAASLGVATVAFAGIVRRRLRRAREERRSRAR
ncbi:MAG TPA: DUF5715 family protein [Gemmatimonadaceae bacterium]|nr:DUF5715 family protein [Gemmatimonadaceae bacterium]